MREGRREGEKQEEGGKEGGTRGIEVRGREGKEERTRGRVVSISKEHQRGETPMPPPSFCPLWHL